VIEQLQDLSAVMRIDERRVLTIAFRALIASRDNEKNADAVLARINELNRLEYERYDAEQKQCAGGSK
jgi:hypothetical protein